MFSPWLRTTGDGVFYANGKVLGRPWYVTRGALGRLNKKKNTQKRCINVSKFESAPTAELVLCIVDGPTPDAFAIELNNWLGDFLFFQRRLCSWCLYDGKSHSRWLDSHSRLLAAGDGDR